MMKTVIFDFDDTITNNQLLDYMAFSVPSKKLSINKPTKFEILKARKKGLLVGDIILPYLKYQNADIKKRFFLYRTEFLNDINSINFLRVQKNLRQLLYNLEKRKISCIICSSKKNKEIIIKFLKKNDLRKFFDQIFVSSDLGFEIDNTNEENRILIKRSLLYSVVKKENKQYGDIVFVGNFEDIEASKDLDIIPIFFQNSYLQKQNVKSIISVNNMLELNNKIMEIHNKK